MRVLSLIFLLACANEAAAIVYKCHNEKTNERVFKDTHCDAGWVESTVDVGEPAKEAAEVYVGPTKPEIGMTAAVVLKIPYPWGRPTDINRTTTAYGVREQWVYGDRSRRYLYFTDGVLTAIQD